MKYNKVEMIGKKFNKLLVIEETNLRASNNSIKYKCQCDCGNYSIVDGNELRRGSTKSCGCIFSSKMIGNKFNKLTVIKQLNEKKRNNKLYLCKCDCGNIKKVSSWNLKSGSVKSCGCISNINKYKDKNMRAKKECFRLYRKRSANTNKEFNLTFEKFMELTSQNCFYCGCKPSNIVKNNVGFYKYNGLDRIDNNKGYIENNVVPCCKYCNSGKNDKTIEDFTTWVDRLYTNLKSKGLIK